MLRENLWRLEQDARRLVAEARQRRQQTANALQESLEELTALTGEERP